MDVKIKKTHPNAVIPKYAKPGDAGMDLTAVTLDIDEYGNYVYGTGLAFEIPEGYYMMIVPRSSNSKTDLVLTNHSGIIDSGYRGEVTLKYAEYERARFLDCNPPHKPGDRVGQLVILPYPQITFIETDVLSDSERGKTGYGSTGA